MAIFGNRRDVDTLLRINKEFINKVVSQQVAIYKYKLLENNVNSYGESSGNKSFDGPFLLNCLIERSGKSYERTEIGINYIRKVDFKFLVETLREMELFVEVGDIVLYEGNYYEIEDTTENQYFMGKDNNKVITNNPEFNKLGDYGESISLICKAHYIPANKLNIDG
jgi:hypothetical protein